MGWVEESVWVKGVWLSGREWLARPSCRPGLPVGLRPVGPVAGPAYGRPGLQTGPVYMQAHRTGLQAGP